MTMSITPDRLQELLHRCSAVLLLTHIPRRELQSLLGVMSFVTACVHPARLFISTLLNTLRVHRESPSCLSSDDNKSDLRWWCHFLPHFNGISLIKTSPGSAIPSTSPPTLATLALAVILMVSFSIPLFRHQSSTVLVMISTRWSSSPSWWLSSSGALLCVDYGLFFTATIATAFRH